MGKARVSRAAPGTALAGMLLAGLLPAGLLSPGAAAAAGPSRFASYDTEADCVAARTLAPGVCRTAFANARAEYETKTPSFPSAALCGRRYAACMAWPPGAAAGATYRPRWDGVDIVDTPSEHSVTPAPGSTGRAVRFAARPLTETAAPLVIRGASVPVPPSRSGPPTAGRPSPAPAVAERAGSPLPPGSGFKLEDGVLTYPAPARFQPRNLPKP